MPWSEVTDESEIAKVLGGGTDTTPTTTPDSTTTQAERPFWKRALGEVDQYALMGPAAFFVDQEGAPSETQTSRGVVVQDPNKGASFGGIARSSIPAEASNKIIAFAQSRYPDLPLEQAVQNYNIINGQIVYKGDGGKWYAEVPDTKGLSYGDTLRDAVANAADYGVSAAGMLGGLGGGALGTAAAPGVGTVGGAMAGGAAAGAGAEGLRQTVANQMFGEEYSPTKIAIEGALNAAGEGAGGLITKGARAIGRVPVTRYLKAAEETLPAGQVAEDQARIVRSQTGADIKLTPGEKTGDPTLIATERALARDIDKMPEFQQFQATRAGETEKAVKQTLENLAPEDAAARAGPELKATAKELEEQAAQTRIANADAAYKQAYDVSGPVDVQPLVSELDNAIMKSPPNVRAKLMSVKRELQSPVIDPNTGKVLRSGLETNLEQLDKRVNGYLGHLIEKGSDKEKSVLIPIRDKLYGIMEGASPEYKAARSQYSLDVAAERQLGESAAGKIANVKELDANKIPDTIMKLDETGIRDLRSKVLMTPGGKETWDAGTRKYLQNTWERIGGRITERGSTWAEKVAGTEEATKKLSAALSPEQRETAGFLISTLNKTGRVFDSSTNVLTKDSKANVLVSLAANLHFANTLGVKNDIQKLTFIFGGKQQIMDMIMNPNTRKAILDLKNSRASFTNKMGALGNMITQSGLVTEPIDAATNERGKNE